MLDKLSSYNFVTNLVPGTILAIVLGAAGMPVVSPDQLGSFLVLAYALGAVSSRLGSLAVCPLMIRFGLLSRRDYAAFIHASRTDPKIDILLETANSYRTLATAGLLFFVIYYAYRIGSALDLTQSTLMQLSALAFTGLFIVSYRKQDAFVARRVASRRDSEQGV